MAKLSIKAGATSVTVNIFIASTLSTTGAGLTGLVFNTSSLTAYYALPAASSVAITLATLAAVTSSFSSGGFKEIDATNMPGWYRFDVPNAALASGRFVSIHFQGATNMAPLPLEIELTGWDNQDAVHGGMSALPNTAVTTNASLLTSGTGTDQLSVASGRVDTGKWLGTAVTAATAGIPDTNAKNINNVATTSVTTINANQGTTQPVNFTGTAGSALVKGDTVDIAGAAVSSTTAQIGTNVVSINSVAASSVTAVNANQGTTQPVNFTGTGASALAKSDVLDWNGTAVSAPATAGIPDVNVKNWKNGTVPAVNVTGVPIVDVQDWRGDTVSHLVNGAVVAFTAIDSGTVVSSTSTNTDLSVSSSFPDVSAFNGSWIVILSGTGKGQTRYIVSYSGTPGFQVVVSPAWVSPPDNTSTYAIIPAGGVDVEAWLQSVVLSTGGAGKPDVNVKSFATGSPAVVDSNLLLKVDTEDWKGTAVATPNVAGVPKVDLIDWLGTAPLALSSQQVQAVVPSSTVVASVTGAVGSVTGNVGGNVVGTVASVVGNVGGNLVGSVGSLTSTAVQNIWDALTSALTTANSIGKLLAALPGSIWDVVLSGHLTAGTTGAALNAASSAGDPWATALPGAYSSGTAGNIVGNRLDVAVSTRLAPAGTLATVTNLTNAPTVGDFTSTMKTSLNASTPTAITGAVGSVTADVGITQAGADKVFGASGAALPELGVAAPAATPSPRSALMLIYMTLRNKLTVTSSVKSIYNDAGTAITQKALSDDSTTYTEDEMG